MTALVTVVVPTYHRPLELQRAIGSALRQTFADFRVCVYDNASNDETKNVVAAMAAEDSRVAYYRHAENLGAFENFTFGMQRVETPFFSFLSDDDVLYPDFLTLGTQALGAHPQAMLFAGSTLELDESGKLLYAPVLRWPREGLYNPPEGAWHMLGNKHPTWTSILFRREVLDRIGLLDRAVGAPCDLDYELQVAAHFPIVISFAPCAAYIRHEQAYSTREDSSVIAGYHQIAEKFALDERLSPPVRVAFVRALKRQTRLKLAEISVKAVVRGDDGVARDALARLAEEGLTPSTAALRLMLLASTKIPLARKLVKAAEAARLSFRARQAESLSSRARRELGQTLESLAKPCTQTGFDISRTRAHS